MDAVLTKHKPNDKVAVEFMQQGQTKQGSLTLIENPGWEIVPIEKADGKLTKAQQTFRKNWLGSK